VRILTSKGLNYDLKRFIIGDFKASDDSISHSQLRERDECKE